MTWSIRSIAAEEASCLLALNLQVHAIHAEARPEDYRAISDPDELRAFFSDWLSKEETSGLVAFSPDGTALGYLIFEVVDRAPSLLKNARRYGMLHHIAVDPGSRRSGIGFAFINEMKARLRKEGIDRVRTVYAAFNAPSAALMRKAGLEPYNIIAEGSA